MPFRTPLLIITLIVSCNLFAQSVNQVIISHASKGKITFTNNVQPTIEIVNGELNISYTSKQGTLFQINGINANTLNRNEQAKKNATIHFIDLPNNRTSSAACSTATVSIQCGTCKPKQKIIIKGTAKLYINKVYYTVKFNYAGIIPEAQYRQSN